MAKKKAQLARIAKEKARLERTEKEQAQHENRKGGRGLVMLVVAIGIAVWFVMSNGRWPFTKGVTGFPPEWLGEL